jgi:hypothetical protein
MCPTRRELFQVGGLTLVSTAYAAPAHAQGGETSLPALAPDRAGDVHSRLVDTAIAATPSNDPWAQDALKTVVRILRAEGIITNRERDFLFALTDALVTAENIGALNRAIDSLVTSMEGRLTELEAVIVAVVRSSLTKARQFIEKIDWPKLRQVVARDARGAFDGAWAGFEYGRMPGAVFGAAIGAGAGSIPAFISVTA